jgi:hypothetical protein
MVACYGRIAANTVSHEVVTCAPVIPRVQVSSDRRVRGCQTRLVRPKMSWTAGARHVQGKGGSGRRPRSGRGGLGLVELGAFVGAEGEGCGGQVVAQVSKLRVDSVGEACAARSGRGRGRCGTRRVRRGRAGRKRPSRHPGRDSVSNVSLTADGGLLCYSLMMKPRSWQPTHQRRCARDESRRPYGLPCQAQGVRCGERLASLHKYAPSNQCVSARSCRE